MPSKSPPHPATVDVESLILMKKEESPLFSFKTPSPKLCVTDAINLVSPLTIPPQSSSVINLVTPSPSPKKNLSSKREASVEIISAEQKMCESSTSIDIKTPNLAIPLQSSFVINLVTGTPSPSPKKILLPAREASVEIILVSKLSDQKSICAPAHACESQHFPSFDAAIHAVYEEEERLGHKWVKGQTKKSNSGEVRRITLRCNHYRLPSERHSTAIDPANHRQGKSSKSDCKAHVNVIQDPESDQWKLNVPNWVHNHSPAIPSGGKAARPPTKQLQATISAMASTTNLGRAEISTLVKHHPDYDTKHPLEPRLVLGS
jgi:hypothetical protein